MKASPKSTLPHKSRGAEQVAAVCYRWHAGIIQFLLVRTGGGRWTFPKGCSEPDLSYAQAAAVEAFEEAGVHGRMEEACFTQYVLRSGKKAGEKGLTLRAYLCEVTRQVSPEESKRRPTWLSATGTKKKLREGRMVKDGAELCRVVDCAATRIVEGVNVRSVSSHPDALRRVPFEAAEVWASGLRQASRFAQVRGGPRNGPDVNLAVHSYLEGMLPRSKAPKALLNAAPVMAHVVAIDKPHGSPNNSKISTKKSR
ncbi:MAG TPA: NUDIX domain-containing protein [Terriglobales bacterium]|nr:NUDIX domain-containing protein [Terriglobales bacterium]